MASQPVKSLSYSRQATLLLFCGGSLAGFIIVLLVNGVWQLSHFWWMIGFVTLASGLLAAVLHLEFHQTLNALMVSLPWMQRDLGSSEWL